MTSNEGHVAPPDTIQTLDFLRDDAASEDFFGSHERLAGAIATVVDQNPDLKIVGLLGPWGSGKSTVIRLLEKKLATLSVPHLVFTYDAWLHQSDPPRRAFLERFLDFMVENGMANAETWREPMDRLNRRLEETDITTTPKLTSAGHWLLLSLVLVPFGTRFLGNDWFKRMTETRWFDLEHWVFPVGIFMAAAPLLVAGLLYYCWRPIRRPWQTGFFAKTNWATNRDPHQHESLLAVVANKTVHQQNSRITKTPEPTTIEFQATFRDMVISAADSGRRLVLVIDNLDRLPETEAIAMWTTIRSFFLGAIRQDKLPAAFSMPVVVLPIDDSAIARIYSGASNSDGPELARSFMDKTFDITFYVNGPVLSDWNAYLAERISKVFGAETATRWAFDIGRLYARRPSKRVTPRDLNRLVNGIGALWLQWEPLGIPFFSVAYYAMSRTELEKDLVGELGKPLIDLQDHDPDWQRSLAAIHFGVQPEHALQVLLEPQIRTAIQDTDHEEFEELVKIRGFDGVLIQLIEANPLHMMQIESLSSLLSHVNLQNERWVLSAWRTLRRDYLSTDLVYGMSAGPGPVLTQLIEHADAVDATATLNAVADKLSNSDSDFYAKPETPQRMRALIQAWLLLRRQYGNSEAIITIRTATAFLDIAPITMKGGTPTEVVRTRASGDQLANVIAARLTTAPAVTVTISQMLLVLHHQPTTKAATALAEAAKTIVSSSQPGFQSEEAAWHIIGVLQADNATVREGLNELVSDGVLSTHTASAFDSGDFRLAGRLSALSIIKGKVPTVPSGHKWPQFLENNVDFVENLDEDIHAYGGPAHLHLIVAMQKEDPSINALASKLFELRIAAHKLGNLYVENIVKNPAPYIDLVSGDLKRQFVSELSHYNDFWQHLASHWSSKGGLRLFGLLISAKQGSVTVRKRARTDLLNLMKKVDSTRWTQEVLDAGPLLDTAADFQRAIGRPLALGRSLFEALHGMLGRLISEADRPFAPAWFEAATFLSAAGRRTLMKNARDQINALAEVPDLLLLLRAGGDVLLEHADFAERGDDSVRHVILPLISQDDGVVWLAERSSALKPWIEAAPVSTRGFLTEQLKERRADASETVRDLLLEIGINWDLSSK